MPLHWDIFCRVVDNYGDIGVCWRLARQLAGEHGQAVRLWVDDLSSLSPLCPACDPGLSKQWVEGVELRHWARDFVLDRVADVVVEAFACELPAAYVASMADAFRSEQWKERHSMSVADGQPSLSHGGRGAFRRPPCWINLEYLTAETWVDGCHGQASPHPALPLVKYFFFPGFTSATGGLLREAGLPVAPPSDLAETLEISLFCYDTAPVGDLIAALAASSRPVLCHVPPGKPLAAVTAVLGPSAAGWRLGNARIEPLPFLPLDDYDALLRHCAINFVRGEDSFVRAQWAGRPFVWQIYPQADDAHRVKLDAFLDRYGAALAPATAAHVRAMFHAWNGDGDVAAAWPGFLAHAPEIARHNRNWARQLAEQPDLAANLVKFVAGGV